MALYRLNGAEKALTADEAETGGHNRRAKYVPRVGENAPLPALTICWNSVDAQKTACSLQEKDSPESILSVFNR